MFAIIDEDNKIQPFVTAVYLETYPQQRRTNDENQQVPNEFLFQTGITMERVAWLLDQNSMFKNIKLLRQNIFRKEEKRGKVKSFVGSLVKDATKTSARRRI